MNFQALCTGLRFERWKTHAHPTKKGTKSQKKKERRTNGRKQTSKQTNREDNIDSILKICFLSIIRPESRVTKQNRRCHETN